MKKSRTVRKAGSAPPRPLSLHMQVPCEYPRKEKGRIRTGDSSFGLAYLLRCGFPSAFLLANSAGNIAKKKQAPKDLPLVVLLGSKLGFPNYSDILFLVTRRRNSAPLKFDHFWTVMKRRCLFSALEADILVQQHPHPETDCNVWQPLCWEHVYDRTLCQQTFPSLFPLRNTAFHLPA